LEKIKLFPFLIQHSSIQLLFGEWSPSTPPQKEGDYCQQLQVFIMLFGFSASQKIHLKSKLQVAGSNCLLYFCHKIGTV